MAATNKTGAGRVAPTIVPSGKQANVSLDDDERQRPSQVVGFTSQGMIIANIGTTTNPSQMII